MTSLQHIAVMLPRRHTHGCSGGRISRLLLLLLLLLLHRGPHQLQQLLQLLPIVKKELAEACRTAWLPHG